VDYYDIAYETCEISKALENSLGYKRIFFAQKDIKVLDGGHYKHDEVENSIFINTNLDNLIGILNMSPSAIIFSDLRINKKAIEQMEERKIPLCLPLSILTSSYGLQRSKNLYFMSKLFAHARKMDVDVSFVTLSKNNTNLCSYMQLIELAKLIGADEDYARKSVSEINKSLVIE
jgi:hypothetical protein